MPVYATRTLELELLGSHRLVAGMDEVGRGALAGPVTVGVAIVDASVGDCPQGLGDSKLLRAAARQALCDPIHQWALACGVGHASNDEIDAWGIVGALRVAGQRALVAAIGQEPHMLMPDVIVLDGVHDWFSEPERDLFSCDDDSGIPVDEGWRSLGLQAPPVRMEVKADRDHAVVAAASNIAKVQRDQLMCRYDDPGYGWASNKGYSSRAHIEGLLRLGASSLHRRSWKLPGVSA